MKTAGLLEQLTDMELAILGLKFREQKKIQFSTQKNAKNFLTNFLVLETIAGTNFTEDELLETYEAIQEFLEENPATISSDDLPYHPSKKRPIHPISFVLTGCDCLIKNS